MKYLLATGMAGFSHLTHFLRLPISFQVLIYGKFLQMLTETLNKGKKKTNKRQTAFPLQVVYHCVKFQVHTWGI